MTDPTSPAAPDRRPDPARLLELAARSHRSAAGARDFELPSLLQMAAILPEYEVRELIGRGGMGAVYRARQKRLDRDVAIKVLPPEVGRDPASAERFQREARALARLSHPNIVRIFDFGTAQDVSRLVLEYVDGTNLRQLMAMGRLSPEEALRLVPRICDALQYAHDQGVVHRDIKPENILIDQAGDVHIADFGLARLVDPEARDLTLTSHRQRLGTPHYMAPEQVETPQRVDHRADIFAVGVVLYEMLTGCLPLGRFGPPSDEASVGPRVDDIVMRSLERDPSRRYQAARNLKEDVEAAGREGFAAGRAADAPTLGGEGGAGTAAVPPIASAAGSQSGRPAPRPSILAIGGLVWFALGLAAAFASLYAVRATPLDGPEPERSLAEVAFLVLVGLAGLGVAGGPIMGLVAIKRIRRSAGRLGGARIAVLAACAPALLLVDWLAVVAILWLSEERWVRLLFGLGVLYANWRFVEYEAEKVRRPR